MILNRSKKIITFYFSLLLIVFQSSLSFAQETVIGKDIKEIKFVYADIDNGIPTYTHDLFRLGFITTLNDGTILKSSTLHGEHPVTEYIVEITGAKFFGAARMASRANSSHQYSVHDCDDLEDGFIIIKAKRAEDKDWLLTEKILFSCGGKYQTEQQKLDDIAAEKARVELFAARAKLSKDRTVIASKVTGDQVGVIIPDSRIEVNTLIEFDRTKAKDLMTLSSLENTNTVEIDGNVLLLGRAILLKEDKPVLLPAIYKVGSNGPEVLDLDFGTFDAQNIAFRDAERLSSTQILVAGDLGLQKMTKTQNGYKTAKTLLFNGENSLYFTDIVSLENNKSASIGYTYLNTTKPGPAYDKDESLTVEAYNRSDKYKIFRDQNMDLEAYKQDESTFKCTAYLVIWDHVTGKSVSILLSEDVSEQSILRKGNNGELIFSLGTRPSRSNLYSKRKYATDRISQCSIQSINVEETFAQNKLISNWITEIDNGKAYPETNVFTITDLIQEDNNDFVFTGIDRRVGMHYHLSALYKGDDNTDIYTSSVVIGRLSSEGARKEMVYETGLNQSLWGGSDRGSLEIIRTPGKLYFSDYGNPKLMESPQGDGYVLMHRGAFDHIGFPEGGFRNSANQTYTDAPLFIHIDKASLKPSSFDLMNTYLVTDLIEENSVEIEGYFRNNKAVNTYQTQYITYNKETRIFDLFESSYEPAGKVYKWSFEPIFNLKWQPAVNVSETTGKGNQISKLIQEEKDFDAKFDAQVDQMSNPTDNNTSSTNSAASSASKYVTITNETGRDIYYVEESSRNPTKISANSSGKLDCSENYWYTFDPNDGINGGRSDHPKLYNANSGCGNSATIE
ncbi:MAG: hypothetical protein HRT58_19340 [Crocinitomicaceae bacterium]|nr:hypothetical protein [Flavobacteriales bacterium]NQZ37825.1 hypothetical protein [Crocinitomicaceae bacterium]